MYHEADKCKFVGYPYGKKAWKLYDFETNNFFESRDVVFHEGLFPFKDGKLVPENMQGIGVECNIGSFLRAGYDEDLSMEQRTVQSPEDINEIPPRPTVRGSNPVMQSKVHTEKGSSSSSFGPIVAPSPA